MKMHGAPLLALMCGLLPTLAFGSDVPGQPTYREACAACHGASGAGLAPDHPNYSSFSPPPADLTDPVFNSSEPAADWFLVVKFGGAALGLSDQMPAYEGALSDAEINEVVAYLKTLAPTQGYPPGELNFLRPVRTIKPFPEREALLIHRFTERDGTNSLRTTAYFADRLGRRGQYEIKGVTETTGSDSVEFVELGYKHTLWSDLPRQSILAGGLEVELPFDSEFSKEVIPYISYSQGLGAFTLASTLRLSLPVDDVDFGNAEVSVAGHWMHSAWPRRVFPGLEVVIRQGFSGRTETALIPQIFLGLTRGGHVALAVGAEVPLDTQPWDQRVHAFLVWDYADGSLFSGWR